jgi:hypothetical protein
MAREQVKKTGTCYIGAVAIDSNALIWPLFTAPCKLRIAAIRFGTNTTMTKADTNYNTFTIKNGTVSVATLANGPNSAAGTTVAAGAFGSFALVTAAGAHEMAAGDILKLHSVKTGNGLAAVAVNIEIDYYELAA